MGNKQAKRERREARKMELYAACLLVNEMPRYRQVLRHATFSDPDGSKELVFNDEYKDRVGKFYVEVAMGNRQKGTPPGRKARKRFVRGYCSWLRKQVAANEDR